MADFPTVTDHGGREFSLSAETELRFSVESTSKVTLELNRGMAEIFGTELMMHKQYEFHPNTRVAIFTWQGCSVKLTGRTESLCVSKDTPMVIYVNVHSAIEQMRQIADSKGAKGPIVLVAGPTDVGKSTLCRILLNYAVRQGRKPVYVDLDVGQGQISVPGTVGALVVNKPADVIDGFGQQMPLVYHYGHKSPGNNLPLYNVLVSRIASIVAVRNSHNISTCVSGVIINTCGWVKSDGYRAITHAALSFEVDVVLVVGHEKLFHQLSHDLPAFVKIVYIPRSGAAVERSHAYRMEARDSAVREYFYGLSKRLRPHSIIVKFSDLKVYRIQKRPAIEVNRVQGAGVKEKALSLIPVQPGFHLLNRVLSVTFSASVEEDVINMNIAGFICITKVDSARKQFTVLSPQAPPLPQCIFLYSDVQFSEERQVHHVE